MKKFLLPMIAFLLSNPLFSRQNNQNAVASLLFKDIKTTLTAADKNQIAAKLGFIPSGNQNEPFALDKDSKEYPFAATVYPTDLNKDGKDEIFIVFGNSYTSGAAGSSVALFIKNAAGVYTNNLGFPGTTPDVLATSYQGYPDLLIGGPGFEFPVWRWNGKTYAYYKKVSDATYSKLRKMTLEEVSKSSRQ
ncbi:hypothetical protein [Chitinophaga tropicalis]|uniref:VCBS repeat-containing protein n=1 Tax=Chitinophaga tropicalis TaxID=2683588 RepID=A0A7K1U525_9BACT|nr:hypothetical protein [Chitinophaga tropicalis]MVT09461.1 hypothetical protein [Chitinophaga tropicalis]